MPQELYQELLDRLARLRRRRESLRLKNGLLTFASLVLAVSLLAICCEAIFHLPIIGRTILFFSTIAAAIGIFTKYALLPVLESLGLRPKVTDEYLAGAIGRHYEQI